MRTLKIGDRLKSRFDNPLHAPIKKGEVVRVSAWYNGSTGFDPLVSKKGEKCTWCVFVPWTHDYSYVAPKRKSK